MLSRTEQRNLYGKLTNNESSSNLSLGDTLIDSETRRIISKVDSNLLHDVTTGTTIANVQNYPLPGNLKKLRSVTIDQGTTRWPVLESPNRDHWNELNIVSPTSYTSNVPVYYYIIGREIYIWPTPGTASQTIIYDYDKKLNEQMADDYTVGSIATVTTGSTNILANTSGTSLLWTDSMAGRYLQITKTNNANSGDGEWYEIKEVSNATTIVLKTNYQGQAITSGTATYIIGEISPLPDGFHELPVYRAAEIYWSKNNEIRAGLMRDIADRLESELKNANEETTNVIINEDVERVNGNNYPRNIG